MSNALPATVTAITQEDPPQPHWCRNSAHLIVTRQDRCKPCLTQSNYRSIARNTGSRFCAEGHGLVRKNVAPDGSCLECAAFAAVLADPNTPIRPAPATWLDWAAVLQALNGMPLVRPLTTRELACLCATLQERGWTRADIAAWLNETGVMPGVEERFVEYVTVLWAPRNGYPDPRITVQQAVFAEADGDLWIAAAIKARREAELAEAV